MLRRKRWLFAILAHPADAGDLRLGAASIPIAETLRLSLHQWNILSQEQAVHRPGEFP